MSKKVIIVFVVIAFIGGIGGGAFLYLRNNGTINLNSFGNISDITSPQAISVPANGGEAVYNDDSGFSFKYPADFVVADITPVNDNSYYSLLEVKKDSDVINISVKDGNYSVPTSASTSASLKLSDFKAKQYVYDDGGVTKTLTLATSQGVSYAIVGVTGNDDEKSVYNSLVASFLLGKQSTPSAAGTSSNTVDEGEEVVQ